MRGRWRWWAMPTRSSEHASGERIDGCDVVVRFNRAHVAGIEDKVGRRTDILVANRNYNLRKAPSPAETLQPRCVVCFLEPQPGIDYGSFAEWTGDLPTLTVFAPDLLAAAQVERTRPVTMGTDALYTFVNLFSLERLFLTGFTFYGAAGSGQGVYWQDDRKSRGVFHDLEPEAAAVREHRRALRRRGRGDAGGAGAVASIRRRARGGCGGFAGTAGQSVRPRRLATDPLGNAAAPACRGARSRPILRRCQGQAGTAEGDHALVGSGIGREDCADAAPEPR